VSFQIFHPSTLLIILREGKKFRRPEKKFSFLCCKWAWWGGPSLTKSHIQRTCHSFFLEITFGVLPFLGRTLRNYKNTHVRYLSHGHPLKHTTGFYFYNVCYLSHGRYFSKNFIFPTSVT
jgi:hypothetical protein